MCDCLFDWCCSASCFFAFSDPSLYCFVPFFLFLDHLGLLYCFKGLHFISWVIFILLIQNAQLHYFFGVTPSDNAEIIIGA